MPQWIRRKKKQIQLRAPDIFPQSKGLISIMNKDISKGNQRKFYFKKLTLNWACTEQDLIGNQIERTVQEKQNP